jgi:uncharacterized protein (DUF952 family)
VPHIVPETVDLIYHVTTEDLEAAAQAAGQYVQSTRGSIFEEIGFVHCSREDKVERIVAALYGSVDGVRRIAPGR